MAALQVSEKGPEAEASSRTTTSTSTLFRFSEEQRRLLHSYWEEKGMKTCSKDMSNIIRECAVAAGCSPEQVKVNNIGLGR